MGQAFPGRLFPVTPRLFPALAPPADYPLDSPSRKRRGYDETPLVATALRGFVACEPQSIGDDPHAACGLLRWRGDDEHELTTSSADRRKDRPQSQYGP